MPGLLDTLKVKNQEELTGKLLTLVIGGSEVADMLVSHQVDRLSIRQIAAQTERAPSTVHRAIQRAKAILKDLGQLPEAWGPAPTPR